jgi:ADP-dependent NAD(P)H-hydrate dehydratase
MIDATTEPLPALPPRSRDGHKGDYGRVLVIGGSRGMAGAPAMTGLATLRSGAGLVTVATPASTQPIVAAFSPCFMTLPLIEDDYGIADYANIMDLVAAREQFDVWAIGPGLGQGDGETELVALNGLAAALKRNPLALAKPAGPRVLTPHPGEFARLAGVKPGSATTERVDAVAKFCERDPSGQLTVILKGHESIVCDGQRFAVNSTGNPGMATGGTGDCLTGVIAGLLGQRLSPWDAARLGMHLHGLAGDLAAKHLGEVSMIASDLLTYLSDAFKAR